MHWVRKILVSLLVWEAMVVGSISLIYAFARGKSFDLEDRAFLSWAFILGIVVVLLCWSVCRTLPRTPSTLIGFSLGALVPIVAGWAWGRLVDPRLHDWPHPLTLPWGVYWGGYEAWVAGLELSIPSGIA